MPTYRPSIPSEDTVFALRAGERVNDQVDWGNVAEEIEDMGNNVVRSVASHLVQAILRELKDVPHWRAEARLHRDEAREAYAPTMARREELAVERLYRRAVRGLPESLDGTPPQVLSEAPGFTLAQLLAPEAEATA